MQYIALDTNTWIYLANGMEPVKILKYIEREINNRNITLLLPDLVLQEWNKNKDNAVKQGVLNHYTEIGDSLKRLTKLLGENSYNTMADIFLETRDSSEFESIIDKYKRSKALVEVAIAANIDIIEQLFNHWSTVTIKRSNKIIIKAGEFAIQNKAPFLKKNSFADAVILFSFIDYIERNKIVGAKFISYNTDDFCERINGRKIIHPDLKPEFIRSESRFFHIVGEAINAIENDILTHEEFELIQNKIYSEFDKVDESEDKPTNINYCQYCLETDNTQVEIELDYLGNLINDKTPYNKNQYQLDFMIGIPFSENIFPDKIESAYCDVCDTKHFKCVGCKHVNVIMDNDYHCRKECENCQLAYSFGYDNYDDEFDEFKIIKDFETCTICDEQYENNGSKIKVCGGCREKYDVTRHILSKV